jgi:ABC-type uncharacterized transport system ATPase subunit
VVAVGLKFLAVNGWQAGKAVAVDEACFAVRPGRMTAFLGPNGAATTWYRHQCLLLSGLGAPDTEPVS